MTDYEQQLLSRRFDFFLAGTAFLILAFATVVGYGVDDCRLLLFANAINGVGFYLAIFFGAANYYGVWKGKKREPQPTETGCGSQEPPKPKPSDLLCDLSCDLSRFAYDPLDTRRAPLVHTWITPLGFALFWLFTWFFVLESRLGFGIGVGLPFLYLFFLLLVKPCVGKLWKRYR